MSNIFFVQVNQRPDGDLMPPAQILAALWADVLPEEVGEELKDIVIGREVGLGVAPNDFEILARIQQIVACRNRFPRIYLNPPNLEHLRETLKDKVVIILLPKPIYQSTPIVLLAAACNRGTYVKALGPIPLGFNPQRVMGWLGVEAEPWPTSRNS